MMMGLAIAHHIRDQVVFVNEPIEVKPQYHFNVEKQYDFANDWGEPLTII